MRLVLVYGVKQNCLLWTNLLCSIRRYLVICLCLPTNLLVLHIPALQTERGGGGGCSSRSGHPDRRSFCILRTNNGWRPRGCEAGANRQITRLSPNQSVHQPALPIIRTDFFWKAGTRPCWTTHRVA